uniref:Calponin-homology (CH) domain-containing protein n=1 Tax=Astyanax mexicanus TaxID=7994 RepID=A0A8B9LA79_ASTMX
KTNSEWKWRKKRLKTHWSSLEREMVQKRTFTRWMNLHLEKCNPPMEVKDLFRDIQDGRILMALLEELSGCRLQATGR